MALLSSGVACSPPHLHADPLADPLARNRISRYFRYLGGFNVFKMSFWRSAAVEWVAQAFDDTGMSYTHRVGEQVFHPLLLALLLPPSSVLQSGGICPFGHHNGKLIWGLGEMDGVRLLFEDDMCIRDVVCDEMMSCSSAEEFWGGQYSAATRAAE